MKRILFLPLIMTVSCTETVIYRNDSYTLFADNVTQGEYVAVAETPHRIVSNFGGDTLVWERKNDLSIYF